MNNVLLQATPQPDIWLELAKAGLPALILGIGCVALWKAWASERAARDSERKAENDYMKSLLEKGKS